MKYIALILITLLSACSYRVEKEAVPSPSFAGAIGFAEVQTSILGPKCSKCHGWVSSYEGVAALVDQIAARTASNNPGFMMPPPGEGPLTAEQRSGLQAWIAAGAPRVAEGGAGPPAPVTPPVVPPLTPAPRDLSFASVRDGVLQPKCARCHSGWVNDYAQVSPRITRIASRVRSTMADQMPPARATPLTEEEKNHLLDWIDAGAPLDAVDGTTPARPGTPCDDDEEDDFQNRKEDC